MFNYCVFVYWFLFQVLIIIVFLFQVLIIIVFLFQVLIVWQTLVTSSVQWPGMKTGKQVKMATLLSASFKEHSSLLNRYHCYTML